MAGATKYVTWSGGPSGDYTCDGTADQTEINSALSWANANPGNTIKLRGSGDANNPHVYSITGQILVGSKTVWCAEPGVCVRVAANAPNFYTAGFIQALSSPITSLEVYGFEIDGNCLNRPVAYSEPNHGSERAFQLTGSSNARLSDINIHDMYIHECFCDAIYVRWGRNIRIHDNKIVNTQHDCIQFTAVDGTGNEIYKNDMLSITDTAIRLNACQNVKVHDNTSAPELRSLNSGNNTWAHGENGMQIADMSMSSTGEYYPTFVTNIEIYNNTFTNHGLAGVLVWLCIGDTINIYIHHNTFKDCGFMSNAKYGSGVSIQCQCNGIRIEYNTFDGCYQNAIQFL